MLSKLETPSKMKKLKIKYLMMIEKKLKKNVIMLSDGWNLTQRLLMKNMNPRKNHLKKLFNQS